MARDGQHGQNGGSERIGTTSGIVSSFSLHCSVNWAKGQHKKDARSAVQHDHYLGAPARTYDAPWKGDDFLELDTLDCVVGPKLNQHNQTPKSHRQLDERFERRRQENTSEEEEEAAAAELDDADE
jgi:hypothetical protein